MHYVFYDTGNDEFFVRVVEAFCSGLLDNIVKSYPAFFKPGDKIADMELVKNFFLSKGKTISPVNCATFLSPCGNLECRENYKAVLASAQKERVATVMEDVKTSYLKANNVTSKAVDRLNFQIIFDNYAMVNRDRVEEIPTSIKKDPLNYKYSNIGRHRSRYVSEAKKLIRKIKRKAKSDSFVYVRAATASHFEYFNDKVRLPGLIVCDLLQSLALHTSAPVTPSVGSGSAAPSPVIPPSVSVI
jgi:hypothetical protein